MNKNIEHYVFHKENFLGSHAQMREQPKWVKPDPKDISRRYFTDYKSAKRFTKSIFDYGYHTNVIRE